MAALVIPLWTPPECNELPFTNNSDHSHKKNRKNLCVLKLLNWLARAYTFACISFLAIGTFCIMFKEESLFAFLCLSCLEVFSLYSLLTNWWLFWCHIHRTDPTNPNIGQRYCHTCKIQVPLNSHHCALCETCVVQKDHHCFFLGKCVYHLNVHLFRRFCFHAAWSCAISFYFFSQFSSKNFKTLWSEDLAYYLLPLALVKLCINEVKLFDFLLVLGCNLSFTTSVFTLLMFLHQTYCVPGTQTEINGEDEGENLSTLRKIHCKLFKFFRMCRNVMPCYFLRIKNS